MLVVARREVPVPPVTGADEDVDWVRQLTVITGWTLPARRPDLDWAEAESRLGSALPDDCKRMVGTFGEGSFDGYLDLNQEPWAQLSGDGLLIWAGTEHEDLYCWSTDGDNPDRWPVLVRSFDGGRRNSTAGPRSSAIASSPTRTTRTRWPAPSTPTGS